MDEQKLADIRTRCKAEAYVVVSRDEFGGRHEDECWQAIEDIAALLRMIDQQQAVIGAARVAYVAGIENLSRSGERMPDAYIHLLAALGDALDALNGTEPDAAG